MTPIREAVEPRRQAAIARALEQADAFVASIRVDLERAGNDLDCAAPRPNSWTMSRRAYLEAKRRRAAFESVTSRVNRIRRQSAPDLVEVDAEKVTRFRSEIAADAAAQFDAYVSKLEAKVGPVASARLSDHPLWDGSVLSVMKADGGLEKWRTRMILNVSCLGKLFNQWPTRRVA